MVEGCFVPVVIAGGEKMENDEDIFEMVKGAMAAGGAGVSIGRNVFQHKAPEKTRTDDLQDRPQAVRLKERGGHWRCGHERDLGEGDPVEERDCHDRH